MLTIAPAGVDVNIGRRDAAAWAEKNRQYVHTGVLNDDASEVSKDYAKKD